MNPGWNEVDGLRWWIRHNLGHGTSEERGLQAALDVVAAVLAHRDRHGAQAGAPDAFDPVWQAVADFEVQANV